jgi:hypothetical protein
MCVQKCMLHLLADVFHYDILILLRQSQQDSGILDKVTSAPSAQVIDNMVPDTQLLSKLQRHIACQRG